MAAGPVAARIPHIHALQGPRESAKQAGKLRAKTMVGERAKGRKRYKRGHSCKRETGWRREQNGGRPVHDAEEKPETSFPKAGERVLKGNRREKGENGTQTTCVQREGDLAQTDV